MRNLDKVIVVCVSFLMFGCNSHRVGDSSDKELDIYFKVQEDINKLAESYGGEISEKYMDDLYSILENIKDAPELSHELTSTNGYYSVPCVGMENANNTQDCYDLLNWMELNSTEEYFNIVSGWVLSRDYDISFKEIYNSEKLLACEKISLTVMHSLIKAQSENSLSSRGDRENCYESYDIAYDACQTNGWIGAGAATGQLFIPGGAGASVVTSVVTVTTYLTCINTAKRNLELCLENTKN